jgi:hypothetical protein
MTEQETITQVVEYLDKKIFQQLKLNTIREHTRLRSYKINPILVKYLSKVLEDNFTAAGIARALFYPRVLGTSVTTSFGSNIQKMFVDLGLASGSLIKGMDIEFTDKVDNTHKWCQLKSGPNTINSEDVGPLLKKFDSLVGMSRANTIQINNNNLIVGVIYGEREQLSQHYLKIDAKHPVHVGTDFWHRITGYPGFYQTLCTELDEKILAFDSEDFFQRGLRLLTREVEESDLFPNITQ